MQAYEMMCVFDSKLSSEGETTGMVEAILNEGKATDINREDLGLKRLAYPIKKCTEGHYYLFRFSLDPQAVSAILKELKIKDGLLRHLIVRREA